MAAILLSLQLQLPISSPSYIPKHNSLLQLWTIEAISLSKFFDTLTMIELSIPNLSHRRRSQSSWFGPLFWQFNETHCRYIYFLIAHMRLLQPDHFKSPSYASVSSHSNWPNSGRIHQGFYEDCTYLLTIQYNLLYLRHHIACLTLRDYINSP